MSQSEQINEIAAALAKAQSIMEPAVLDKVNPHFKSKYASLASIIRAVRKPLTSNNVWFTHDIGWNSAGEKVTCYLIHSSGQWKSSEWAVRANNSPQARASEITYGKRNTLAGLCGVAAEEDDDGNEATKATTATQKYGNKPEDFVEHDLQYDEDGNPVDNIPAGQDGIKPMSKAMGRPEYAKLLADIKSFFDLEQLTKWGHTNANRVATLPPDWQIHLRDEFRSKQIELGWKPKA